MQLADFPMEGPFPAIGLSHTWGHDGPPWVGGSLVGVGNGWGYGIAFFRALNFQNSEPEIWQESLFLRNFRDFPGNFGL